LRLCWIRRMASRLLCCRAALACASFSRNSSARRCRSRGLRGERVLRQDRLLAHETLLIRVEVGLLLLEPTFWKVAAALLQLLDDRLADLRFLQDAIEIEDDQRRRRRPAPSRPARPPERRERPVRRRQS